MNGRTLLLVDVNGVVLIKACYVKEETKDQLIQLSAGGPMKFNVYVPVNDIKNNNWRSIVRERLEMICPSYHMKKDVLEIADKTIVYLVPREKFNCSVLQMTVAEAEQYKCRNMLVYSDFLSSLGEVRTTK